eukprot:CFRG2976T1
MVCTKCEKKLAKLACPEPWKDGSRNKSGKGEGSRKINENKLLASKKNRKFNPYGAGKDQTIIKCKICKSNVHQQGSIYCQDCAFKKGLCAMCGKLILETKNYKQSQV